MQIKKVVEELTNSKEFRLWKEDNKESYLAHLFRMMDEPNEGIWQLGYYNPKEDKITTFIFENEGIKIVPPSDIFKKPDTELNALDIESVSIDWMTALENASEFREKEYRNEWPVKSFFILQSITEGVIYNLTLVTKTFNTLNIKVSAKTGKIISSKLTSLFEIAKMEKGLRGEQPSEEEDSSSDEESDSDISKPCTEEEKEPETTEKKRNKNANSNPKNK
jgi:hypothetical protein